MRLSLETNIIIIIIYCYRQYTRKRVEGQPETLMRVGNSINVNKAINE